MSLKLRPPKRIVANQLGLAHKSLYCSVLFFLILGGIVTRMFTIRGCCRLSRLPLVIQTEYSIRVNFRRDPPVRLSWDCIALSISIRCLVQVKAREAQEARELMAAEAAAVAAAAAEQAALAVARKSNRKGGGAAAQQAAAVPWYGRSTLIENDELTLPPKVPVFGIGEGAGSGAGARSAGGRRVDEARRSGRNTGQVKNLSEREMWQAEAGLWGGVGC